MMRWRKQNDKDSDRQKYIVTYEAIWHFLIWAGHSEWCVRKWFCDFPRQCGSEFLYDVTLFLVPYTSSQKKVFVLGPHQIAWHHVISSPLLNFQHNSTVFFFCLTRSDLLIVSPSFPSGVQISLQSVIYVRHILSSHSRAPSGKSREISLSQRVFHGITIVTATLPLSAGTTWGLDLCKCCKCFPVR